MMNAFYAVAAFTIARKLSDFSEAPPTNAPSMSF
jgi:hypothetical protein